MAVMTHLVSIPSGRPFTVADLEAMPHDGNRYELIDGVLIVSPAPSWEHQEMGLTAYVLLRQTCPRDMRAMAAPFAVQTGMGAPSYWLLDPTEPGALTVYALRDGSTRRSRTSWAMRSSSRSSRSR